MHGREKLNNAYNENLRKFALTLHYYSPRAYKYVRQKFDNHLPHKSTIQKWYANTNVSGEPGICKQSFEILTARANQLKGEGIDPMCSLIFDEMAIRKLLKWSHAQKKFIGQINYGFRPEFSEVPIANQAMVYMLSGINFDITIPIAFYFIRGLKAEERAELLKKVIGEVKKCGVRVINTTFDGYSSNFKMCKLLGANFDLKKFKPYFVLPGDERKIYVILDPSHVLKLVRNALAANGILYDDAGLKLEWEYFINLENLRVEKKFSHVHKLTKRHIQFEKFKMNVRVAAETLSGSVANSMQHLMDQGHELFLDSSATIKFVRFINDCFDIMNTKSTGQKSPVQNAINPGNKDEIFSFFETFTEYLKKMQTAKQTSLIRSPYRTPFRGLIINMANFKMIYEECVESNTVGYLATFKFRQDHLESFFGRIRSMPGSNDNPTVDEFISAFKKIVVCNEIRCSEYSNCSDDLRLNILTVPSTKMIRKTAANENEAISCDENCDEEQLERLQNVLKNYESNDLLRISTAYIASTIEEEIQEVGRFQCGDCYDLFTDNEKITFASSLKRMPCQSTFDLCETAHKYVEYLASNDDYSYENAKSDILREFNAETAYPSTNFEGHEEHKGFFIDFICSSYIRIQASYIAARITQKEQQFMAANYYRKRAHAAGE